jgi:hypothetical protein
MDLYWIKIDFPEYVDIYLVSASSVEECLLDIYMQQGYFISFEEFKNYILEIDIVGKSFYSERKIVKKYSYEY